MYKQFWLDLLDGKQVKFSSNHINSDCPVCEDTKRHFYANINSGLWDCKKCQNSGNAWSYLSNYRNMGKSEIIDCFEKYRISGYTRDRVVRVKKDIKPIKVFDNKRVKSDCERLTEEKLIAFANERGLSVEILKKHQLGMNDKGEYTIPFYDEKGRLRNIQEREFGPGANVKSIQDGQVVLFGVEDLIGDGEDIFIVEGAWSALALKDHGYKAVGTCGAGTLLDEQIELFKSKEVFIIPDNDEAGITGAERIKEKLENVARHIYIIEIPVQEKQDIRDFFKNGGSEDHFTYLVRQAITGRLSAFPITLENFLRKDIPNVEYYVKDILQKGGKGMISASPNVGKSIFVQNIALDIACGSKTFLDKFEVSQARVLYLDLEMGEPALKERFTKMAMLRHGTKDNMYIKYVPSLDLMQEESRKMVEEWITELKIKVLILDPLGSAWSGNENDQEEVGRLTSYLNTFNELHNISILVVHHWRKATKEFKTGGQMAAGSYKWSAWLDNHITLSDNKTNGITVSCEKNRNREKFQPFLINIQEDLSLSFVTDFKKKDFPPDILDIIFDSFGLERVAMTDMVEYSEKMKDGPKQSKLRELIDISEDFMIDKNNPKKHYVMRKQQQNNIEWEKDND